MLGKHWCRHLNFKHSYFGHSRFIDFDYSSIIGTFKLFPIFKKAPSGQNRSVMVSISKSIAKCKINIDIDFTDYTDFHNNY